MSLYWDKCSNCERKISFSIEEPHPWPVRVEFWDECSLDSKREFCSEECFKEWIKKYLEKGRQIGGSETE